MMAPDYTHWHGMYEVAERFYMELIPQARELADRSPMNPLVAEVMWAVTAWRGSREADTWQRRVEQEPR